MLRSFLLVPCLLICLACATPFPLDSLEEGMTAETVSFVINSTKAVKSEKRVAVWMSWLLVSPIPSARFGAYLRSGSRTLETGRIHFRVLPSARSASSCDR